MKKVFAVVVIMALMLTLISATSVLAEDTPPVAVDDYYSMNQDTTLNVGAPGVLANDYDIDGDPIVVRSLNPASSGTIVLFGDGHFTYTPVSGFTGLVSVHYYISNSSSGEVMDDAYIYITVLSTIEDVDIDIKPGSYPNSINLGSKGIIPVAILTTATFDATTVDPASVEFAGANPLRWAVEDVDYDGDLDVIFLFKIQEVGIIAGDIEATLTGQLMDSTPFTGTDTIRTVPENT